MKTLVNMNNITFIKMNPSKQDILVNELFIYIC